MTYLDFRLPLARNIVDDWYAVHVRLCETLGERIEDGAPRYLFADDPVAPEFGRRLAIRTSDVQVARSLDKLGLPCRESPRREPPAVGETMVVAATISSRVMVRRLSDRPVVVPERDAAKIVLDRAGFDVEDADLDVRAEGVRILKNPKRPRSQFRFQLVKLRARVVARRPDLVARAFLEGLGRDRGLGVGIICEETDT